jgi:hypothetical protein
MGLHTCTVSCTDARGYDHSVEVTADSLFEAVAQGLRVFRENNWVDDIGRQLREFERWLESQGRTPAEVSLKGRLRELLKSDITPAGSVANRRSDVRNRDR